MQHLEGNTIPPAILGRLLLLEQQGMLLVTTMLESDPDSDRTSDLATIAEGHRQRAEILRQLIMEAGSTPPSLEAAEEADGPTEGSTAVDILTSLQNRYADLDRQLDLTMTQNFASQTADDLERLKT